MIVSEQITPLPEAAKRYRQVLKKLTKEIPQMEEQAKKIKKELEIIEVKYENGEKLSYEETEIFCLHYAVTSKSYNGLPDICDDFKFQKLYLIYYSDLSFKSKYIKPNFGAKIDYEKILDKLNKFGEQESKKDYFDNDAYAQQRQFELEIGLTRLATLPEILSDKNYLEQVAQSWKNTIVITNHSNQNLQLISKEARDFLKIIEKLHLNGEIDDDKKQFQINLLLWKTKHIHLTAEEILDRISPNPYPLTINNKIVYFTYHTLIHILNRHFGELVSMQMLRDTKSFHSPIFQPDRIHLILDEIFKRLSCFKNFQDEKITFNKAINFKYRNVNYQVYFKLFGEKKDKLFISSIYPIEDLNELIKLKNLNQYQLDEELSVYLKS